MNLQGVVFDFDGTLVNTIPVAHKATCHVLRRCGIEEIPSLEDYFEDISTSPSTFYARRGVSIDISKVWEIFNEVYSKADPEFYLDSEHALRKLREFPVKIGLITAQRGVYVNKHLELVGLTSCFDHVVTDVNEKTGAMREFCSIFSLDPARVGYIGDSASDMHDAVKVGVRPIGCPRHHSKPQTLIKAGAECCIRSLDEVFNLIEPVYA